MMMSYLKRNRGACSLPRWISMKVVGKKKLVFLLMIVASIAAFQQAMADIQWRKGNWALGCDFAGRDFRNVPSSSSDCGGICARDQRCTHFAWANGVCYLKEGKVGINEAITASDPNTVCGVNGNGIIWNDGNPGKWASQCDFIGNDIGSARTSGADCGPRCGSTPGCTHFTWTDFNSGTCWMKGGSVSIADAFNINANTVCGLGPTKSATGVRGTYWSTQSDSGGCQMPEGSYAITDAIALGQGNALGELKYRPGMCGQVVDITCSSGVTIPAVIVSTCDINSDSCGIDMIAKTWNKATNNASPGVTSCSVALSTANPLDGPGPKCYHRTGSAQDGYSRILGVLNTGGEISASAMLAGKTGRRSNGHWFEFNSNGQDLFINSAEVVFTYESGKTATFRLSDCAPPTSVHIFSSSLLVQPTVKINIID